MITRKEKAEFGKTAQGTIELLNKLSPEMKAEIVKALTGESGRIMEGIVEDAINNIAATGEVPVGAVDVSTSTVGTVKTAAMADYDAKMDNLRKIEEELAKAKEDIAKAEQAVINENLHEMVTLGDSGITVPRGLIFNPLLAGLKAL